MRPSNPSQRCVLPALLLLLLLSSGSHAAAGSAAFAPGDLMPDLRGHAPDGGVTIVDFSASRYTLINFWADWCEPCKLEMPALQRAHERLGPQGLQILGVTHEAMDAAAMAEFAEAMQLTYPLFRIAQESKKHWPGASGTLPNSFLVDSEGRLVRRYVGASAAQIAGLERDLEAVIAGGALGTMPLPDRDSSVAGGPDKMPK